MEVDAFLGDCKTGREAPSVFREITCLFLPRSVHNEKSRLSSVFTEVGSVPAKLEVEVEDEVVFIRVSDAVLSEHGALFDENVSGGRGAFTRFKRPLNAHWIASLIAGQHDFDGGKVGATVGFRDLHVEFVGLAWMKP